MTIRTIALIAVPALLLAACAPRIQDTSGAAYLARYDAQAAAARTIRADDSLTGKAGEKGLDPAIIAAAGVEPILQFPARIGLARIEGGKLSPISAREAKLWQGLADRYRALGDFVPVDPLVAYAAAESVAGLTLDRWRPEIGTTINVIRLGSARQHLDAVLIYEVGATSTEDTTFASIAELTIIGGGILPTRVIESKGAARALLIDVRNGYPYGTAQSETEASELSTAWGSDRRERAVRQAVAAKVAADLIPEVETMFKMLVDAAQDRALAAK